MSIQNNELPQNPSIESETVRPFRRFCTTIMTIGSLPSSYQEAMSYQEMLLWLCDFIENKVIPAFDNNANAIKELQNLYVELKSYVDNYFNNLDVQKEIDNKLDKMATDGTFYNLINNLLFNDLNNKVLINSNNINNILNNEKNFISENQPNSITMNMLSQEIKESLTGGSTPIVAKNSISNFNIINKSLDILNLNNELSNVFYNDFIDINFDDYLTYSGYITINDNKVKINSIKDYYYYKIPLIYDKIYQFNGSNIYQAVGCVITDNNDNVIYSTKNDDSSSNVGCSLTFRSDENCKYAYITRTSLEQSLLNNAYNYFGYFNKIYSNIKYNDFNIINPNYTINDSFIISTSNSLNKPIKLNNLVDTSTMIYKIKKGLKYKIISYNFQYLAGLCISDNNFNAKYISSTINYEEFTKFEYEFIADFEGFIVTSSRGPDYDMPYVCEYNKIKDINNENLNSIKIGFTGDSICAGDGYKGGYAKCLNEIYDYDYQNLGVSGGWITNNENTFVISNSIANIDSSCDLICIEGGVNDYSNSVPLGELTPAYNSSLNTNTFYGSLEKMFRDCYNLKPGIPVFYVISHNANNAYLKNNSIHLSFKDYIVAIKNTCKKYGIKVVNLCENSTFNTGLSDTLKNNYTANSDGLHPNKNGYNKFYVPIINECIKSILLIN